MLMEIETNASRDRFFSELPPIERLVFQKEVIMRLTQEVEYRYSQITRAALLVCAPAPAAVALDILHAPKSLVFLVLTVGLVGVVSMAFAFRLFRRFEAKVKNVKQLYLKYEDAATVLGEQYPFQYPIQPARTEKL
jgi:hypothetical protein